MAVYDEEEYLSLSALQHMIFCRRQCALIHIEQLWSENRFTAEGRIMHERVDRGDNTEKGRVRIEYSLPLKSDLLGVTGKADVVEFREAPDGRWIPYPVEYKRGKSKKDNSDRVQLCAQAICLEEMTGTRVEHGALFYGKTMRREDVIFSDELRQETISVAAELHEMFRLGKTPEPQYSKKCDTCSFLEICLPETLSAFAVKKGSKKKSAPSVADWMKRMISEDTE